MLSLTYIKNARNFNDQRINNFKNAFLELWEQNSSVLCFLCESRSEVVNQIKLIVNDVCNPYGISYTSIDISQFIENLDGLLTALIESQSLQVLLKNQSQIYSREREKIFNAFSRTYPKIGDINQTMEDSPNGYQETITDLEKAIRIRKRLGDQQLSNVWLDTINDLANYRVVFFLYEFDTFVKYSDRRDLEYLWGLFERLYSRLPNFRLVLVGRYQPFYPSDLVERNRGIHPQNDRRLSTHQDNNNQ